jgi:signal transduction histidine kinase/ligand-binding sensor domain-containing protein
MLGAVVAILLSCPVLAAADGPAATSYVLTSWTAESGGLPIEEGSVAAIAQDRNGYLWLGTTRGLIRFDGFRFVAWGTRGEPPLPGKGVRALVTARDDSLWIAYTDVDGVSRVRDGHVTHYSDQDGLPPGILQTLIEDRQGTIWAGGHQGLATFREERWSRVGREQGVPDAEVYSLHEERRGRFCAGTSAGVLCRAANEPAFVLVDRQATFVQAFAEDSAGAIWVTDPQRIVRKLGDDRQVDVAAAVQLPVAGWRLLSDSRGTLWIAALGSGLLQARQNSKTGRAGVEAFNTSRITGAVQALFVDRENNLWIGMRGGLLRVAEGIVTAPGELAGLTSEGVRGLTVSGDSVWVATSYNVTRFSGQGRQVYDIRQVQALHTDLSGAVWVVTLQGIHRFADGRSDVVPLPPAVRLEGISSVTTDARGGLWFCARRAGLFRVQNGEVNRFESVREVAQRPCSYIYTDRQGQVWIGFSTGGVAVHDGGRFVAYAEKDGLAAGKVTGILEDDDGAVWIRAATGLSRLEDGRFMTLSPANGLPEAIGPSMVYDTEGYLWMTVRGGLLRMSPREADKVSANPSYQAQYTLYDRSDGLSDVVPSLSRPGAVRGGDGKLWFATSAGIAVIDPRRLTTSRSHRPIPVHVEGVVADGRAYDPAQPLAISPYGSTLQIDYSAVSPSAAAKLRFRYRIDGYDRDWIYSAARRQASYTNLSPGNYRFRVTATNDGTWQEPEATWGFTVRPPFYRTGGFYTVCAVIVALGLWLYWWLSVRAVRHKYTLVLAERTRVSRDIHDTLLQSLGAVGLGLEVVARQLGSSESAAGTALRELQSQVTQCIREARQSVWDLRSPRSERDLAEVLRSVARNAASGKEVRIDVNVIGRPRPCSAETQEELVRVGGEAVRNAVQHGKPEQVRVELEYLRDSLRLRVADNGCGFVPADVPATGQHCGLMSMRERAAKLGGRFSIVSDLGSGTVMETIVPLA